MKYIKQIRINGGPIGLASAQVIEGNTETGQDEPARLMTESDYPAFFGEKLAPTLARVSELTEQVADMQLVIDGLTSERDALKEALEGSSQSLATVSRVQAKLALQAAGIDDAAVMTAINNLDEPERSVAAMAWAEQPTFSRDSKFVSMLGAALGMDEGQIDTLFATAAQIGL